MYYIFINLLLIFEFFLISVVISFLLKYFRGLFNYPDFRIPIRFISIVIFIIFLNDSLVPSFTQKIKDRDHESCLHNLKRIESSIKIYNKNSKVKYGSLDFHPVDFKKLIEAKCFISETIKCDKDGKYTYSNIAKCSIHETRKDADRLRKNLERQIKVTKIYKFIISLLCAVIFLIVSFNLSKILFKLIVKHYEKKGESEKISNNFVVIDRYCYYISAILLANIFYLFRLANLIVYRVDYYVHVYTWI